MKKFRWVLLLPVLLFILISFSFIPGFTALFVVGLALLSIALMLFLYVFPAVLFGGNHDKRRVQRLESVNAVTSSGALMASAVCGGNLGGIYVRGPLIDAEIYPGGIVLSTLGIGRCALYPEQIKQVIFHTGFWTRGIDITHNSKDISGPIFLRVSSVSAFTQALKSVVSPEKVVVTK